MDGVEVDAAWRCGIGLPSALRRIVYRSIVENHISSICSLDDFVITLLKMFQELRTFECRGTIKNIKIRSAWSHFQRAAIRTENEETTGKNLLVNAASENELHVVTELMSKYSAGVDDGNISKDGMTQAACRNEHVPSLNYCAVVERIWKKKMKKEGEPFTPQL